MHEAEATIPAAHAEDAAPPLALGRYRIVKQLGAGGMGVVLEAYDPSLDRHVAIKLLHRQLWADATRERDRLSREAQAMARLSHPNVVVVHEVGWLGDRAFLAMERVDGGTLRTWQAKPHRWRDIVAMYVATGRGLAAAHAEALVHRDFKPDNVLIGRDGRPRVTDFGLVTSDQEIGELDANDLESSVSIAGRAVGTPGYMSPEHWSGTGVDARSDQFSFCVALWEALHGQRPFTGSGPATVRVHVMAGTIDDATATRRIPRSIEQALRRGLTADPAQRWPSMDALIEALERGLELARRRLLIAGVVGAIGIAAIATALIVRRDAPEDPCAAPTRAPTMWGVGGREGLIARLQALDPALAPARIAAIVRWADPFVEAWDRAEVDTCHASSASDALAAQRTACLDDRFARASGLLALIGTGDGPAVDRAIPSLAQLPSPSGCADAHVLAAFIAPRPDARVEADAIDNETRAVDIERIAGKFVGLHARATALAARARSLDHPPTTSRALRVASRLELDLQNNEGSAVLLGELIAVAARAADDDTAAWAWANLLMVTAFHLGKPADAMAMIPAAHAAVLRAGNSLELRTLFLTKSADVYSEDPKHIKDAMAALDEVERVLTDAGANRPDSPLRFRVADLHNTRAYVLQRMGDWAGSLAAYQAARTILAEVYGEDHPLLVDGYTNAATALRNLARHAEAEKATARAVQIARTRVGPSTTLAWALALHCDTLNTLGRAKEAVPEAEEAYALGRKFIAETDPTLFTIILGAAVVFETAGDPKRAKDMYTSIVEIADRTGTKNINVPIALYDRGNLARTAGDCAGAVPDYERAHALFTQFRSAVDPYNVYPLRVLGQCRLRLGRPVEAITELEAALALKVPPRAADEARASRYLLGVALIRSGRDVARGRAEQAAARAEAVKAGGTATKDLDDLLPDD